MNVFHHHDRAIDHHADADGEPAERHEIRAQPVPFHHDEGEERGQRQDERDDERAAHIGQQHDEDDEDEDRAFGKRFGDGVDRLLHQIGAVVERHQLDAFRQRLLNRGQLLLHRIDDIAPARAFEHQHDAGDGFALAVGRHRALPQLRADLHARPRRGRKSACGSCVATMMFSMSRVSLHQPEPAHDVLLRFVLDKVAAGVRVVLFQRLEDLLRASRLNEVNRSGFTITWYCFTRPPKSSRRSRPGTVRRIGRTM